MEEEDTDVISSGFEVWFEELGAEALSAGKRAPMKASFFEAYNSGATVQEVLAQLSED